MIKTVILLTLIVMACFFVPLADKKPKKPKKPKKDDTFHMASESTYLSLTLLGFIIVTGYILIKRKHRPLVYCLLILLLVSYTITPVAAPPKKPKPDTPENPVVVYDPNNFDTGLWITLGYVTFTIVTGYILIKRKAFKH